MKTILLVCFIGIGIIANGQNNYKRYEIKSARVEYKTVSPQGNGTKTLLFDDYGTREKIHEKIYNNNKLVVDKLTLLNGDKAYSVDLLTKKATNISASIKMAKGIGGNNMSAAGKEMLESMGGKRVGQKTMLGKTCDVWQLNTMGNTTLLVYKSIPLSIEIKVMGFTTSQKAVAFQAGVSSSQNNFKLPQGVVLSSEKYSNDKGDLIDAYGSGMTKSDRNNLEKLQRMSYDQFKTFVKQNDPGAKDDEIKMIYNMMKAASGSHKR